MGAHMRKYLGRLGLVALLAAAAPVVASRAQQPDAPASPAADPVPQLLQSPEDLARGKSLFTGACGAYCHQPTHAAGGGGSDAPFLFGCDWRHGGSNAEIFHTISQGVPGTRMVPFGGAIEDADIWRIVAYLKSASQCKAAP